MSLIRLTIVGVFHPEYRPAKTALILLCLLILAHPASSSPQSSEVSPAPDFTPEILQLKSRVEVLEGKLESLRRDYDERLGALEARLSLLVGPGADQEPGSGGEAASAGSGAEPGLSGEERVEREGELAAILGEAGADSPPSFQLPVPAEEKKFADRTRSLNRLNPEISVTGDVFGTVADTPESNRFEFAEFELAFQATLDPFALAKAFVVQEEGEFEVEEAYIDWTALPGGLGLKFGQFRHDWGKLNRWHQHALPQSDRPLVHKAFYGEEGLKGLGVSLSWLPTPFFGDYNELWLQVTNDDNDVAFSGRSFDDPIFLARETNYWDLSSASYLEVGLSAATGVNDELGRFRTQIYGVDCNFDWRPPARALYKGLELRGELLWQRREEEEGVASSWGAYTYASYKLDRRWFLGLRADWTELPAEPGGDVWGLSPYVEWWQSEWTRLRVQYSYGSRQLEETESESENRVFFQVTWALGPHKHEKY